MSPEPPKWLPDGWIMEIRRRKDGKEDRYYISPVSRRTFRSRAEVMRYLNFEKVDGHPRVSIACSEDNQCLVERGENSPLWLPNGWIMEIRTRKSGAKVGTKYKSYYDPVSKSRFYSKGEVFRHLKAEQSCDSKHKRKRKIEESSDENVLALIESSPDGLPSGWIKEIKCRRNASGIRRDPYYTDPVSGYVFRSMRDVYRFLETGEISKHAFRPREKKSINEVYAMEDESPPPISAQKLKGQETTVRRCLFMGKETDLKRKTAKEKGWEAAGPSCLVQSDFAHLEKEKKKKTSQIEDKINPDGSANGLPEKPLELAEEAALDQVIENLLDSVSKSLPDTSNKNPLEPENEEILGVRNGESSQSCVPVHVGPPPKKQLDFEMLRRKEVVKLKRFGRLMPSKSKSVDATEKVSAENPPKIAVTNSEDSRTKDVSATAVPAEPTNEKLLVPAEKISEPEEKLSKLANEEITEQGTGESDKGDKKRATGNTPPRQSRVKTKKTASLPRRASKRLAGLEATPTAAIEFSDRSLRRSKLSAPCESRPPESPPSDGFQDVLLVTPLSSKKPEDKTTDEKPESPIMSPFGDSWPDPCIEFAFKTLTGEIPVLDDPTIGQDFFHQEVSSIQAQVPGGSVTLGCGSSNGLAQADIRVKVDSMEKQHPPVVAGGTTGCHVMEDNYQKITRTGRTM